MTTDATTTQDTTSDDFLEYVYDPIEGWLISAPTATSRTESAIRIGGKYYIKVSQSPDPIMKEVGKILAKLVPPTTVEELDAMVAAAEDEAWAKYYGTGQEDLPEQGETVKALQEAIAEIEQQLYEATHAPTTEAETAALEELRQYYLKTLENLTGVGRYPEPPGPAKPLASGQLAEIEEDGYVKAWNPVTGKYDIPIRKVVEEEEEGGYAPPMPTTAPPEGYEWEWDGNQWYPARVEAEEEEEGPIGQRYNTYEEAQAAAPPGFQAVPQTMSDGSVVWTFAAEPKDTRGLRERLEAMLGEELENAVLNGQGDPRSIERITAINDALTAYSAEKMTPDEVYNFIAPMAQNPEHFKQLLDEYGVMLKGQPTLAESLAKLQGGAAGAPSPFGGMPAATGAFQQQYPEFFPGIQPGSLQEALDAFQPRGAETPQAGGAELRSIQTQLEWLDAEKRALDEEFRVYEEQGGMDEEQQADYIARLQAIEQRRNELEEQRDALGGAAGATEEGEVATTGQTTQGGVATPIQLSPEQINAGWTISDDPRWPGRLVNTLTGEMEAEEAYNGRKSVVRKPYVPPTDSRTLYPWDEASAAALAAFRGEPFQAKGMTGEELYKQTSGKAGGMWVDGNWVRPYGKAAEVDSRTLWPEAANEAEAQKRATGTPYLTRSGTHFVPTMGYGQEPTTMETDMAKAGERPIPDWLKTVEQPKAYAGTPFRQVPTGNPLQVKMASAWNEAQQERFQRRRPRMVRFG